MADKVKLSTLILNEAFMYTDPQTKKDLVFVVTFIDPNTLNYTALQVKGAPRTFDKNTEVVKIDAPPLFPSVVIGAKLLLLP
jgi:hypothetical protein